MGIGCLGANRWCFILYFSCIRHVLITAFGDFKSLSSNVPLLGPITCFILNGISRISIYYTGMCLIKPDNSPQRRATKNPCSHNSLHQDVLNAKAIFFNFTVTFRNRNHWMERAEMLVLLPQPWINGKCHFRCGLLILTILLVLLSLSSFLSQPTAPFPDYNFTTITILVNVLWTYFRPSSQQCTLI